MNRMILAEGGELRAEKKMVHADYADDADKKDKELSQITQITQIKNRKVDVPVNQKENRYGMNRMILSEDRGLRAERKNGARRLRR